MKKLLNKLKTKAIKDSYFGEMGSTYDKSDGCFYLDKDIELEKVYTPVTLYLKTSKEKSNKSQQLAYESIKTDFTSIWNSLTKYIVETEQFISDDQLKKEYRLESITLPEGINGKEMKWEMDLINLKDGFSRIVIELENNNPINHSVEA
ncbi:hypothetical protein [Mangrovivirga cuniculi]|uniref:Uncharacterized protein n=1 Tax=Mangrovivirga cuniculi TaxID=2715131 RepID=A0A4D7K5L5_9BACT|nr:hypothetical protein [Mangrovivirga cuniculi]QCK16104.1 hypothetical protein DCC35_15830 [Mangrovivirga cuniculi]